jgi:predicted transcriptional regulator
LRVEQERIALEKLTLKADQEALQERQEILTQIKNGIVSAKVSIQQKLQAERDQLDKEKAEYERVINTIILNETNETIVEDDNTVQLIGNDSDFIII